MLLEKTDKARQTLKAGTSGELDLRDRRILILADGKRSADAIAALLGPDSAGSIDRLLRDDYLAGVALTPGFGPVRDRSTAFPGLLRSTGAAGRDDVDRRRPAPPSPAIDTDPAVVANTSRATPRRSLAAAKMYMLDMLQLQRTTQAASARVAIQCAATPEDVVDALLDALRHVLGVSTPTYGDNISSRLAEILPMEALPRLDAIRGGRHAAIAAAVTAASDTPSAIAATG